MIHFSDTENYTRNVPDPRRVSVFRQTEESDPTESVAWENGGGIRMRRCW